MSVKKYAIDGLRQRHNKKYNESERTFDPESQSGFIINIPSLFAMNSIEHIYAEVILEAVNIDDKIMVE